MRVRGVAAARGAGPVLAPKAAPATAGSGISGVVLAAGTANAGVKVKGQGPTDVIVREVTIQPGGHTGWHYHPGQVVAVVKSGTLTRTLDDCSVEVSGAGSVVFEPGGRGDVHIGRNHGTEPVVLYVTYVLPKGSPLSVDVDPPACAPH
ncbi:cupin domain-containing protein [Streptomyces sp. NBC_00239]